MTNQTVGSTLLGKYKKKSKPFGTTQHIIIRENNPNKLTNEDVAKATKILIEVDSGTQYPLFIEVPKENLQNVEDSTTNIRKWYFEDVNFNQYFTAPNNTIELHIVIGARYYVHDVVSK